MLRRMCVVVVSIIKFNFLAFMFAIDFWISLFKWMSIKIVLIFTCNVFVEIILYALATCWSACSYIDLNLIVIVFYLLLASLTYIMRSSHVKASISRSSNICAFSSLMRDFKCFSLLFVTLVVLLLTLFRFVANATWIVACCLIELLIFLCFVWLLHRNSLT